MDGTQTIILIAESQNDAHEALKELKRLVRTGWIDLTYYALVDKDSEGAVHFRETSESVDTVSLAAGGVSGWLVGSIFRSVGAVMGAAAGARALSPAGNACPEETLDAIEESLQSGNSALLTVLEG